MNKFFIQISLLRRMSWLTLSIILITLSTASFWRFVLDATYVAANEVIPSDVEQLQDQAIRVQDPNNLLGDIKATLKLADGGVLKFHYSAISDSGVHLQRLDNQGKTIWEQDCAPLGVMHSEYGHKAFVYIEGQTVKVISVGSRGSFVERLDLSSGRRIARSIRCDSYGNPPRCIPAYPLRFLQK